MIPKLSLSDIVRSATTPHPARDWTVALGILLVLFVLLIVHAAYLFIGIRWGTLTGVDHSQASPIPEITRTEVESTLELYRVRRANFDARNFWTPGTVDPR